MDNMQNKIDEIKVKVPNKAYYWTCEKCGTYKIPSNKENCPICKARKNKFCKFYTFGNGGITYKGEETNQFRNMSMTKLNAYEDKVHEKTSKGDIFFIILFTMFLIALLVCFYFLII